MQIFSFIAAFLLIRDIQKSFKKDPLLYIKWNNLLRVGLWTTAILALGLNTMLHGWFSDFIAGLTLLGMVSFIKNEPDLTRFRPFAYAHLPLVATTLLYGFADLILGNSERWDSWNDYLQIAVVGAFIWIFARSAFFKKQQKELEIVSEQKNELEVLVAERTSELTLQKNELLETLKELKATQAQLIHQEKLASLGELTAGIAHEIQNPLNFVNNFSEVSMELLDEMEAELAKGDIEEVEAIAADIKQNLQKIIHHGKRADSIVKGMLQHSRTSTGQKEPTNINTLADEYLRLAYHGLRAKDKLFNATLVSHLAPDLPPVNAVAQDVGRVLLNLFTNAFYAVQQKQKTGLANYQPTVSVTTTQQGSQILISVKDNGTGIPEEVRDKIMQPFFTTKPTGEGTGLGLSLSYDIIVKGHGGKIDIQTQESEYTEFLITLPV
ncbi:GHKL domain-containing protein [Mucilaginibacter robiniae]|uniref:histidine kinase n=1 Tax=Mucilaginibacter robiniae TaxID=2728022 RepID=A0A7L5E001_9SPHI|nr:ATP-binding protein [Mucilaginibacter robiniae]QJD96692.1 GHKL domain-containing protein [Mucilaginibacter robiniae]